MAQTHTQYGVGESTSMTRNSLLLVAACSIIFSFLSGQKVLLDFGLATLSFHAILWAFAYHSVNALDVERRAFDRAMEESDLTVSLTLTNRSVIPSYFPACRDFFPVDMSTQHQVVVDGPLRHTQAKQTQYIGHCFNKRGDYKIGPATLIARDPFGIIAQSRTLPTHRCQELLVLPRVAPVDAELQTHRRSALSMLLGSRKTGLTGPGYDIQGLRDYRAGDPLQHIHWRLSAHRHQLIVKQFEHQTPRQAIVLIDLSLPRLRGIGRHSTHEYAIRSALAIAYHALQSRQGCAILCHAQKSFVTPFYHQSEDLLPTLVELARVKPATNLQASNGVSRLQNLVAEHLPSLRNNKLAQLEVIVVSPAAWDDFDMLKKLGKDLHSLLGNCHFHLIDVSTFHAMNFQKLSAKQEQAEFDNNVRDLAQANFTVTVQRNTESLDACLRRRQLSHNLADKIVIKPVTSSSNLEHTRGRA